MSSASQPHVLARPLVSLPPSLPRPTGANRSNYSSQYPRVIAETKRGTYIVTADHGWQQ
jgi:hypothetical protein